MRGACIYVSPTLNFGSQFGDGRRRLETRRGRGRRIRRDEMIAIDGPRYGSGVAQRGGGEVGRGRGMLAIATQHPEIIVALIEKRQEGVFQQIRHRVLVGSGG